MPVLVVYASKHGATRGIAGRIAAGLRTAGCKAEVRPVQDAGDLAAYDAFVIGSAAYEFHWRKEATEFVRRNTKVLAARPVWLFSSGPLGTGPADAKGRDLRTVTVPKEIPEFTQALHPRGHRVSFGALDPAKPIPRFCAWLSWGGASPVFLGRVHRQRLAGPFPSPGVLDERDVAPLPAGLNIRDDHLEDMLQQGFPFRSSRQIPLVCPVGEYSRWLAASLTWAGRDGAGLAGGIVAGRAAGPAAGVQPRPRERQRRAVTWSRLRRSRTEMHRGSPLSAGLGVNAMRWRWQGVSSPAGEQSTRSGLWLRICARRR